MKKTVNIPLGAQHISLLEPIRFNFTTENEKITGVDWDVGFVHRGIEKACVSKFDYKQVATVVARVCGLCAITHSSAYVMGVEKLLGVELNQKIKYLRIMMLELDRIHSHMLCLSHVSENAGFEGMFMKIMNDRELVMEALEVITGNRVQFDFVTIGGVNRELTASSQALLLKNLAELDKKIDDLIVKFASNWSASLKYKNVGILTLDDAYALNALGPIARASGASIDVRASSRELPYHEVGYEMVRGTNGDVYDRNMVRLLEIKNSINMVQNIAGGMPEGEILIKTKGKPKGESMTRLEAPRGEIFYYLWGDGQNMLKRVRIKTPTFASVPAMVETFMGAEYGDAHVILASFDPCMSCTAK